jgi:hypothetical protein
MHLNPLNGVLLGIKHIVNIKLLLRGIFIKDFSKDIVLELAQLLHNR